MNNIAISPHIFMYALQNQNVERKIAKKIDIKELNKELNKEQITSNEEVSNEPPIEIIQEKNVLQENNEIKEPSIETINSLNSELNKIGSITDIS
jgi:hypothetical protein